MVTLSGEVGGKEKGISVGSLVPLQLEEETWRKGPVCQYFQFLHPGFPETQISSSVYSGP